MYQAITTKFMPATNTRGSRIKVSYAGGKKFIYVSWDHALNVEENHKAAARVLIKKLDWVDRNWYVGTCADSGYVFVQVPRLPEVAQYVTLTV